MQTYSTPEEAIGSGFLVFGLCSAFGFRRLWLGLTNQIIDDSGMEKAPRWLFLGGGIVLQFPLLVFIIYLSHQGFIHK